VKISALCCAFASLLAGVLTLSVLALPSAHARDKDERGAWRYCAAEGQVCRVDGQAIVRYGSSGRWFSQRVNGRVACANERFGDPAPEQPKRCEVLEDDRRAANRPQGSGWAYCADEGAVCRVRGEAQVRFGDGQRFTTRSVSDAINCDVNAFGDPAFGQIKRCEVRVTGSSGPFDNGWGGGDVGWTRCAAEGGQCNVGGRAQVRYGADGRYAYRDVRGSVTCNNERFGGDPTPGQRKSCEMIR